MNSVYIHIPFCTNICSYCDFCKFYYNKKWIKEYLMALKNEINERYKGEEIKTLYIGGGTPSSLDIPELEELFKIIGSFKLSKQIEFTIECNSEDLSFEKLEIFKKNKINRLSIGIQTFNKKLLKQLNRTLNIEGIKLAFNTFDNINLDMIYAEPGQTLDMLKKDLKKVLDLNPKHISLYSLIIESNTIMYINKTKEISEEEQSEMYNYIKEKLKKQGYIHYELSNFAQKGYESKHNLVYWNNQEYYGFGLGASGYIDNFRYTNTRSINKYNEGKYTLEKEKIDKQRKIEDEFMLGFRKIKGINKKDFYNKFKIDIKSIEEVSKLLKQNILVDDGENIFIKENYLYVSNEIIQKFINLDLLVH